MKYVFFGTPKFAAIILERLIAADLAPSLIVCNPDRPVGRKKIITPPPAKVIAEKHNIPVWQPEKIDEDVWKQVFQEVNQPTFGIVASYNKIIQRKVIDSFPKGIIGVHPSLLPKYRGTTPIQSVILSGEKETGTALFQMDEKIDHGPVFKSATIPLADGETYLTLHDKLAELSADLLIKMLPEFSAGKVELVPQNEALASYTKKFNIDSAYVDMEKEDSVIIERKIRAMNPEPGAWTMLDSKRTKLLEAELVDGKVKLKKIHIEGKKPTNL